MTAPLNRNRTMASVLSSGAGWNGSLIVEKVMQTYTTTAEKTNPRTRNSTVTRKFAYTHAKNSSASRSELCGRPEGSGGRGSASPAVPTLIGAVPTFISVQDTSDFLAFDPGEPSSAVRCCQDS